MPCAEFVGASQTNNRDERPHQVQVRASDFSCLLRLLFGRPGAPRTPCSSRSSKVVVRNPSSPSASALGFKLKDCHPDTSQGIKRAVSRPKGFTALIDAWYPDLNGAISSPSCGATRPCSPRPSAPRSAVARRRSPTLRGSCARGAWRVGGGGGEVSASAGRWA